MEVEEDGQNNIYFLVEDENGEPHEGVTLNLSGPIERTSNTDSKGEARFVDVPVDDYTVTLKKSGYENQVIEVEDTDFDIVDEFH